MPDLFALLNLFAALGFHTKAGRNSTNQRTNRNSGPYFFSAPTQWRRIEEVPTCF